MPALVVDGRQIAERGVAAAWIVEALDELEDGHARFGLRLEPAAIEKLALERGEEALRHRVVVGVADRAHRGPHAGLAAALAERDGGILRALIRVMDDILRPARCERHVQRIEHDLGVQASPSTSRRCGG